MFFIAYSSLSILQHNYFESHAFDLGIFDQAIWHISRFELPASTIRGFANIFGDHFHPIILLATPMYWIWSDVRSLLILQVLLYAISSIPIYLYAKNKYSHLVGYLWTTSYLLFWGVQSAIFYDFHEIAFAVPLVSFGLYFILQKRYSLSLPFIFALLLVKEDMSFLVAAFGILMLIHRKWRIGSVLIVSGIMWFFVVTKIFIPNISGTRGYYYWRYGQLGNDIFSSLKNILKNPLLALNLFFFPKLKTKTLIMTFAPFAGLAVFSSAVVLTLPLFAEKFLSTEQTYWSMGYHYTAVLAPIVALSSLDGLNNLKNRFKINYKYIAVISIAVLSINMFLAFSRGAPISDIFENRVVTNRQIESSKEAMELIPSDATVIAQDTIAPHLTHRKTIYDFSTNGLKNKVDYIILNTNFPYYPMTDKQYIAIVETLKKSEYKIVYDKDGWLVFKK